MMVSGSSDGGGYIVEIILTSEGFRIKIFNGGQDGDGDGERTRDGGEEGDNFDGADGERAQDAVRDGGEEGDDFDSTDEERAEDEVGDGGEEDNTSESV
ncbi:hypothetical protein Syun_018888 [Stephania yunnanensis]|uniref:Uncharacterized protein n=1 Tax=Stephania yunnanensis TaxID=152371 RepID=A0AAP0NYU9_9MAGN